MGGSKSGPVRTGVATAISVALLVAASQLAAPVAHAESLVAPDPVVSAVVDSGASTDTAAIADAADDFTGTAKSAAELADAASATDKVALATDGKSLVAGDDAGAQVSVAKGGDVTLSSPGMPDIGLGVVGDPESTKLVDGALVQTEVAPSTDVVTRATDSGVQMVVVLGGSDAPTEVEFPMDLPDNANLVEQADGSISVVAPVKTEVVPQAESDAFTQQVADVVGDATSADQLDESKWAQLAALPTPDVVTQVVDQQIGTIQAPWAVDANGSPVATHYEVDGGTLKQVIDTTSSTAFPVTADPEWWWWAWTATSCVADVASFVFAAAKLAKVLIKMSSIVKKSATVAKWVKKLGGAEKTIKAIYYAAKGFLESGRVGKYLTNTTLLALSGFAASGLTLIGDALGIGSCVSLIRELL